jgi:hypothetical protein
MAAKNTGHPMFRWIYIDFHIDFLGLDFCSSKISAQPRSGAEPVFRIHTPPE